MSLDYNFSQIKDLDTNFPPGDNNQLNDDLHVMVWGCATVGLGQITEKNYREWWARYEMWTRVIGPLFHKLGPQGTDVGPYLLTLETVRKAIGLHTNVKNETRTAFMCGFWKAFDEKGPR